MGKMAHWEVLVDWVEEQVKNHKEYHWTFCASGDNHCTLIFTAYGRKIRLRFALEDECISVTGDKDERKEFSNFWEIPSWFFGFVKRLKNWR